MPDADVSLARDPDTGFAPCWACYFASAMRDMVRLVYEKAASIATVYDESLGAHEAEGVVRTVVTEALATSVRGRWLSFTSRRLVLGPAMILASVVREFERLGRLPNDSARVPAVQVTALAYRDSKGRICVGVGVLDRFHGMRMGRDRLLASVWPELEPKFRMHQGAYVVVAGTRRPSVELNLRRRLRRWADGEHSTGGPLETCKIKAPKVRWIEWLRSATAPTSAPRQATS